MTVEQIAETETIMQEINSDGDGEPGGDYSADEVMA